MYTSRHGQLGGFFLTDAIKTAVKFVSGGIQKVAGTQEQTGAGTPVYAQVPPPPAPNYTPWIIGGAAALLGVVLLTQGRRRR